MLITSLERQPIRSYAFARIEVHEARAMAAAVTTRCMWAARVRQAATLYSGQCILTLPNS